MARYTIAIDLHDLEGAGGWMVLRSGTAGAVYYGTWDECNDWIERNGHDDWN